ncbi:MAG: P-II family nitrogen regulator [Patescibacteria group bacterium]
MKKIEAIIRPFKMEHVQEALDLCELHGFTITEVKGLGKQKGNPEIFRGQEYTSQFVPKFKVELVLSDAKCAEAVAAIIAAAKTGKIGDGKIFVSKIDEAIRIRTEETGDAAV